MKGLHTEITKITNPYFTLLYSWKAQERYWVKRERGWYVVYSFFFVLIIALLAVLGEFLLIIGVISFLFLWFIQAAIPPEIVEHNITTLGIKSFGKLYKWRDIQWFWFSDRNGITQLNLDIVVEAKPESEFKKRLSLIVDNHDKEVFTHLIKYLDYGNKDNVGFNILAQIVYGKYIDIFHYLPKEKELEPLDKKSNKKAV